MDVEIIVYWN